MSKRKYVKKSDYWKKFEKKPLPLPAPIAFTPNPQSSPNAFEPKLCGESFASERTKTFGSGKASRKNRATGSVTRDRYSAIYETELPYSYGEDGIDIRDAIDLCQRAYASIPIFKNSIDLMSEFSNSQIYLEGGNKASRAFFEKWFELIRLDKLSRQYFLEYYRSSNVFLYKFDGRMTGAAANKLSRFFSKKSRLNITIPTRYVLLNPYDIVAANATSFSSKTSCYEKVLSQYELESLRNPKTENDRIVFESLPDDLKKMIKSGKFNEDGARIPLEAERLIYSFAKKQDYEPFAVPFGFPVLGDLNMKIELKKFDQAIMRTIENVILLITMGAKPEDGGVNPHALAAMQKLFEQESSGRVLVSDYTTKAEFIIPDISKIVGKQKYEILNEDIRDGLQNIITGSEKYAATQVKAQLFLERLNEARDAFLNDVLIPQMKATAKAIGLTNVPTPYFSEKNLKDEVQFTRAVTRLMELGLLNPAEGIKAINTGVIADDPDILEEGQRKLKEEKKNGFYEPITGGAQGESGRPTGSGSPQTNKRSSASTASLKSVFRKINELHNYAESFANGDDTKKELLNKLCESVIVAEDIDKWKVTLDGCITNSDLIDKLEPKNEVLSIAAELDLGDYQAAILYHAKQEDT